MKSKENLQKEQLYREFVQREENLIHAPYNPELEFYSCIREGNVEKIKQLCNEPLTDKKGLGKLSENELQHFRYHFAITAALAARYCIEGGLDLSTSYTISDFYIRKADHARTLRQMRLYVLRGGGRIAGHDRDGGLGRIVAVFHAGGLGPFAGL